MKNTAKVLRQKTQHKSVVKKIKNKRLQMGYTQSGFAKTIKMSRSSYAHFEGNRKSLDLVNLLKIISKLQLDTGELLKG